MSLFIEIPCQNKQTKIERIIEGCSMYSNFYLFDEFNGWINHLKVFFSILIVVIIKITTMGAEKYRR